MALVSTSGPGVSSEHAKYCTSTMSYNSGQLYGPTLDNLEVVAAAPAGATSGSYYDQTGVLSNGWSFLGSQPLRDETFADQLSGNSFGQTAAFGSGSSFYHPSTSSPFSGHHPHNYVHHHLHGHHAHYQSQHPYSGLYSLSAVHPHHAHSYSPFVDTHLTTVGTANTTAITSDNNHSPQEGHLDQRPSSPPSTFEEVIVDGSEGDHAQNNNQLNRLPNNHCYDTFSYDNHLLHQQGQTMPLVPEVSILASITNGTSELHQGSVEPKGLVEEVPLSTSKNCLFSDVTLPKSTVMVNHHHHPYHQGQLPLHHHTHYPLEVIGMMDKNNDSLSDDITIKDSNNTVVSGDHQGSSLQHLEKLTKSTALSSNGGTGPTNQIISGLASAITICNK